MADYTQLTPEELDHFLSKYDLVPPVSITPQEGGQANSSFRVSTGSGDLMLSVCDEKNKSEIDKLTRLLAHLRAHGFPTSTPVETRDHTYVHTFGAKPVYLKTFSPGQVTQEITPAMATGVGRAMARLHKIPAPNELPPRFCYGIQTFDEVIQRDITHPFREWLSRQKSFLDTHLDPTMDKALIHGDIYWDNLVFQGEELAAVLDFEEACFYFRLFDLAMCMVGCCARNGKFDRDLVRALVRGYETAFPLSDREKAQLTVFVVYAAAAGAFWRFRQYNIRYPLPDRQDDYKALAVLADQARNKAIIKGTGI